MSRTNATIVEYCHTTVARSTVLSRGTSRAPSGRPEALVQTILIIEDDTGLRELMFQELSSRHSVLVASSAEDGLRQITSERIDAVVTDVNLGGMTGVELCSRVRAVKPELPIIVMTADNAVEHAIGAIRAGAYDYVAKPFDFDHLALIVERALALHALRQEVARLSASANVEAGASPLFGKSPALAGVLDLIDRVASTTATVLVTGESGTGKELVARAIHDASDCKNGPFVPINCAAMPESLLESELFGHSRGAFTDAKVARPGLFVRANRGTIFLDEIGEMAAGMQAKLLRAVQERRVRPIGSDTDVPFDARIIAATHRDLDLDVKEGRFREDLFYRINVVRIAIPPLRARSTDILLLAQRFIQDHRRPGREVASMSSAFAQKLLEHPWPGNVRQLQNCIERAIAVSLGPELQLDDLPDEVRDHRVTRIDLVDVEPGAGTMPSMDEIERRYIRQVMTALGGNKTAAAEALGFDRRTLYRKLARMNGVADADEVTCDS